MESLEQEHDGGQVDPAFAVLGQVLIVLAQAARAAIPGDAPLHDPPAGQYGKALLLRRLGDDPQVNPEFLLQPADQMPV